MRLKSIKGTINIVGNGRLYIGFGDVEIFDRVRDRTLIAINGTLNVKGDCYIGHGSSLSIAPKGILELGHGFRISANSDIICHNKICFGDGVLISWNVQILDTPLHEIQRSNGTQKAPSAIVIGKNVWINVGALLLQGTHIADGCVVLPHSVMNRTFSDPNRLVGRKMDSFVSTNTYKWRN